MFNPQTCSWWKFVRAMTGACVFPRDAAWSLSPEGMLWWKRRELETPRLDAGDDDRSAPSGPGVHARVRGCDDGPAPRHWRAVPRRYPDDEM